LIAAMTFVSGTLLLLHPAPIPPLTHIHLLSTDDALDPAEILFDTVRPAESVGWRGVSIRFSGHSWGSIQTVSQQHQRLGLGGVAHHFVIGNGTGSGDGQIDMGFRWRHQEPSGLTLLERQRDPLLVDICLIGDGQSPPTSAQLRELVWLIRQLQARLTISSSQVVLAADGLDAVAHGFPEATLRQQLYQIP
jgi:hypothetical protein